MKSLFHIEQQYAELAAQLTDNGGELTPEIEAQLTITQDELENKARNYAFVIKSIESDNEIIDAEIARLRALKTARDKSIDRLKSALSYAMQTFGIEKIDAPLIKLSFRKSESVEITNEELIDKKFMTEKITYSISKTKIKEAINAGEIVLGAIIQTNKNLQIK